MFPSLLLENEDLLVLVILEDEAQDHGVVEDRRPHLDRLAVLDQEDTVEMGFPARLEVELLDGQDVPFLDAVLLSACHDHCVHLGLPFGWDKKIGG